MIRFRWIIILWIVLFSCTAGAIPIEGVSATTTYSTIGLPGASISNIVNGSGLTSYSVDATHVRGGADVYWSSDWGETSGSITFDLGRIFDIDGMAVWNFNLFSSVGVDALTIESSIDGASFAIIPGAPTNFSDSFVPDLGPYLAELFSFTSTAQFVRFNVISNHNSALAVVGLDEVMFTGRAAVATPATLVLLGLGFAALGFSRLKFT